MTVLQKESPCFSYGEDVKLKVDIYIKKENRVKSNEFLFSRKNSSQVVVYYNDLENNEKHLVLVEEFRSSVNNSSGFVLEIPGGSSFDNEKDKKSIAASEVFEEIGLSIKDLNRFVFVNERQTLSSLSSHISTLFKLEITKDEFDFIINNIDNTFGNKEESEITKISIIKFSDLFNYNLDFSNIGMIYSAFLEN
jgi:8-oxo-dGTP pyrophosphatase MutT (NUDIX family)